MAHANILCGDQHALSLFGLTPPSGKNIEGGNVGLTPVQEYLFECWEHCRTVYLPSVCGAMPRILWLAGDSIEGLHHGGNGVDATEIESHVQGAVDILKPLAETCEKTFMVAGTEAHAGALGQWDELVAEKIGAQSDGVRHAPFEIRHRVDGVLFHMTHHIGGSYVDASDMTPLVGEWVAMQAAAADPAYPMPDVIVRGHSHLWRTPYVREDKTVIALPGWQARTPYAFKLRRARAKPSDIGLVVVITDEGKYEVLSPKIYKWPAPHIGVTGWTSQNPPSLTKSGPTFLDNLKAKLQRATG
jgi:hypothetical protein